MQDKSGREALQNFTSGDADVLLSYEYEATTANKKGEDLDYVIPDDTIKINIDIATTKDAPAQAKQFVDYVLSDPAQERFASWGYRPVNEAVLAKHAERVPDAVRPVHDRGPRRLVEGQRRDVRSREGLDRQDRGGGGGVDRQVSATALPSSAASRRRARLPTGMPRPRHRDAVAQHHRAAAALGRRRAVRSTAA